MEKSSQRGQLLVEAMIAITIVTVGLLGVFSLLGQSLGTAKVVGNQYIAANLAAEGIELIRNVLDTSVIANPAGWGSTLSNGAFEMDYNDSPIPPLSSFSNNVLRFDAVTGLYSYDIGSPTPFKRRIEIVLHPDVTTGILEQIQVNSIVEWTIKGGAYSVNVEDRFFDWIPAGP